MSSEIYDADALALPLIRMVMEADTSDESSRALLEAITDAIDKAGAVWLVQMLAGHGAGLALMANPDDPGALLADYEQMATLNRLSHSANTEPPEEDR